MKSKLVLILLCLTFLIPTYASAAAEITISTVTPAVGQSVTLAFPIPDDRYTSHTMKVTSSDGTVKVSQETTEKVGNYAYVNITFKEEKTTTLTATLSNGSATVLTNTFNVSVKGANSPDTKVDIKQVGTQNGMPTIQAAVKSGIDNGTYSLTLSNPITDTTFSKTLPNSGTEVIFVPTNYTQEGNYNYVLKLNGNVVTSGYIQLKLTKNEPKILAEVEGSILTLTINNATDYIGQQIQLESGSYKSSFVVSAADDVKAFTNVSGLGTTVQFFSDGKPVTSASVSSAVSTGGNVNTPPAVDNSGSSSSGPSTPLKEDHTISMKLDKTTYDENDVITANISVSETNQYSRSVTLRVAADSSSVIKVLTLDSQGKGEVSVKLNVPLNSSRAVYATLYAINGDTINSTTVPYNIKGQTGGGTSGTTSGGSSNASTPSSGNYDSQITKAPIPKETGKPDYTKNNGQFDENIPSVDYVAVDLSNLENKKGTLAWYRANHVQLYTTTLIVTNNTTHDQHSYKVWMPNGDGKVNLDLVYDGPGIYTWTLTSGGKIIAQAPYSTTLGTDRAGVLSQDGLPVVIPPINVPFDEPQAPGSRPGEVNGANLGTEIGAVVDTADQQVAQKPESNQLSAKDNSSGKKAKTIIILSIFTVLLIAIGIATFIVLRREKRLAA